MRNVIIHYCKFPKYIDKFRYNSYIYIYKCIVTLISCYVNQVQFKIIKCTYLFKILLYLSSLFSILTLGRKYYFELLKIILSLYRNWEEVKYECCWIWETGGCYILLTKIAYMPTTYCQFDPKKSLKIPKG